MKSALPEDPSVLSPEHGHLLRELSIGPVLLALAPAKLQRPGDLADTLGGGKRVSQIWSQLPIFAIKTM